MKINHGRHIMLLLQGNYLILPFGRYHYLLSSGSLWTLVNRELELKDFFHETEMAVVVHQRCGRQPATTWMQ